MTLTTDRTVPGDGSVRTAESAAARLRAVSPSVWLAVIALASFASLVVVSLGIEHPFVFRDELVYSGAAKRLVLGQYGATGDPFAYGPLYPLAIAPVYAVIRHAPDAYVAVKILNAALFSACAFPAYALARRLVRPPLALAVAALTVLLPARAYSFLVLTESLAFLLFLLATLAVVRALERPAMARQLVALATCALAVETRRQSLVLLLALPVSILVLAWLDRGGRPSAVRRRLAAYLPTGLALAAGVVALGLWSAIQGRGPGATLGPYSVLTGGYDVSGVAAWLRNDMSALGLMFAVIPIVTLPLGVRECLRRTASDGRRAVGVLTLVLVPALVLQVSAFSSTPYGLDMIHERYLFYVAPLLFALLALWIELGGPHRTAVLAVSVLVAALPLMLPLDGTHHSNPVDAPVLFVLGYDPLEPGGRADQGIGGFMPAGSFHVAAVLLSAYLIATLLVARRRFAYLLVGIVAAYLVLVDVRVDDAYAGAAREVSQVATGGHRSSPADWIEHDLGRGRAVTYLYVYPTPQCRAYDDHAARAEAQYWRTEFFNSNISNVLAIGRAPDAGVEVQQARLGSSGAVVADGRPVSPRYVVTDEHIRVRGVPVGHDAATRLTLWRVSGPLRLDGVGTESAVRALVCRPALGDG